jgi:hypothetical protein
MSTAPAIRQLEAGLTKDEAVLAGADVDPTDFAGVRPALNRVYPLVRGREALLYSKLRSRLLGQSE